MKKEFKDFKKILKERRKFKLSQLKEYEKQLDKLLKEKPHLNNSIRAFDEQIILLNGKIREIDFIIVEFDKFLKGGLK